MNNNNKLIQQSLYLTFLKQIYLYQMVNNLNTTSKRNIYKLIKKSNENENLFLIHYGITTGEFAVFQKLNCGPIPESFYNNT